MLLSFYILAIGLLLGSCQLESWRACWFLGWSCRWAFWTGHCRLWVRIVPSVLLPGRCTLSLVRAHAHGCFWAFFFWQYVLSTTHCWSVWLWRLSTQSSFHPQRGTRALSGFQNWCSSLGVPTEGFVTWDTKGLHAQLYLFTSYLPASFIQGS